MVESFNIEKLEVKNLIVISVDDLELLEEAIGEIGLGTLLEEFS